MGSCHEDCVIRLRVLNRQIRACVRRDRKARASRVALEAEGLLATNQAHEACRTIQGWCRSRTDLQSKPAFIELQVRSQECESLCTKCSVPGPPLLVTIDPCPVPDDIPDEDEIITALLRIRKRRAAGPTGVKVEMILHWRENCPQAWALFIHLVQVSFPGFEVPIACSNLTLMLLPENEEGKFRGVTLLEVMLKVWEMTACLRAIDRIQLHPDIHGFRHRRGCNTAILEAKLEMQWAACDSVPCFQMFLDLAKACDSIDRTRLLDVLAGCGFGPNTLRFL